MANSASWAKIFKDYEIDKHNFEKEPYFISASQIKRSVQKFKTTTEKEVRILCKQDSREDRPEIFKKLGLFLLPTKNGTYAIIQGEGYVDIPKIEGEPEIYKSKLAFRLETAEVGDSEMQHLDFAYAASLIRTFVGDPTLVLTIRGRKYTPEFNFLVGGQKIGVQSVQTEVDAGYEGENQVVLLEAKGTGTANTIIRQLYYPYRQWQARTKKEVSTLFFEKDHSTGIYSIWQFGFKNPEDYSSIYLIRSGSYKIKASY